MLCFDATGSPLSTEFTLSYQYQGALYGGAYPPKYFGYVANLLSAGPVAGPTDFNSVTGTAWNTVAPLAVGQWLVTFPQLAQRPDNVQVTEVGSRRRRRQPRVRPGSSSRTSGRAAGMR